MFLFAQAKRRKWLFILRTRLLIRALFPGYSRQLASRPSSNLSWGSVWGLVRLGGFHRGLDWTEEAAADFQRIMDRPAGQPCADRGVAVEGAMLSRWIESRPSPCHLRGGCTADG